MGVLAVIFNGRHPFRISADYRVIRQAVCGENDLSLCAIFDLADLLRGDSPNIVVVGIHNEILTRWRQPSFMHKLGKLNVAQPSRQGGDIPDADISALVSGHDARAILIERDG